MVLYYIYCLVLFNSVTNVATITVGSITVTQVRDAVEPFQNSNAYVVTSSRAREGFFIDTGFTNSTTSQLISVYQAQVLSTTKPPNFVFVTHGHPDHVAGVALIRQVYPTVPIYVASQQIIMETLRWTSFSCDNNFFSAAQCALNYSDVLTVIKSPRTQLIFNDRNLQLDALNIMIKGESSYAAMLGATLFSKIYWLFTGDAITIKSHLFVSNFFEGQTLPASDDALCAWAGNMQASVCELQLAKYKSSIFPGHGPISDSASYPKDVDRNIAWLRSLRNLTFNSCNKTYIWNELFRLFPDFGQRNYADNGAINTHVPTDANSVNCNCTNGSPTICPVYNTPPSCMHLDVMDSPTTLACDMKSKTSWPFGIINWLFH